MMEWLQNPHADYVCAAYGIALVTLCIFALSSWRFAIVENKKLHQLKQTQSTQSDT